MYKALLKAAPAVLLAGCGAFPSQVQNPSTATMTDPAAFLATSDGGASVPTVKDGLLAAKRAEAFARTWRNANKELLLARDSLNNAQFGLVVAGVYNTVRNSMPAGKWALAGAGGVGVVADRYQIEAQATAYRQGAEVMECVRSSIEMVPASIWAQYDSTGLLQMDVTNLQGAGIEKAQEAYDSLTTLLPSIFSTMSNISNKVFDNVSSKVLRVPKADDIVKAVQEQQMSAKDSSDKAKALYQASKPGANTDAAEEELRELQNDLELAKDREHRTESSIAALTQAYPVLKSNSADIAAAKAKSKDRAALQIAESDLSTLRSQQATATTRRSSLQGQITAIKSRTALVTQKVGTSFPSKPAIELALKLPAALKACEANLPK